MCTGNQETSKPANQVRAGRPSVWQGSDCLGRSCHRAPSAPCYSRLLISSVRRRGRPRRCCRPDMIVEIMRLRWSIGNPMRGGTEPTEVDPHEDTHTRVSLRLGWVSFPLASVRTVRRMSPRELARAPRLALGTGKTITTTRCLSNIVNVAPACSASGVLVRPEDVKPRG